MPPRKHKARNQEMIYKEYGNVPGRSTYKLVEVPSDPVIPDSYPEPDKVEQGNSTTIVGGPVYEEDLANSMDRNNEEEVRKQTRRGKV